MVFYFVCLLFLFVGDRLSKLYLWQQPTVGQATGGFLLPRLNQHLAFSLPLPEFIVYPLIIIILFFLIKFWWQAWQRKKILIWPWGLLIIGALSNFLDRIYFRGVIDFINLPGGLIINLADIYISGAVIWLLIYFFLFDHSSSRPRGISEGR